MIARHGGGQVFLFGPEGQPFWASRLPVQRSELTLLRDALDLIERLEAQLPRPFLSSDPGGRFVVAALDTTHDLYVVRFGGPDRVAAEARVVAIRDDLADEATVVREQWRKVAQFG